MYQNAIILEKSSFGKAQYNDEDYDVEWTVDLGSDGEQSACPTPQVPQIKCPVPYRAYRPPRSALIMPREAELDCGICFELTVVPVRTLCCAHLFCAEHLDAWLHGPNSDGLCPACCSPAPEKERGLLALGHPALHSLVLLTPPPSPSPSRSTSPSLSSSGSDFSTASYPYTPSTEFSSSDSEEENTTYFSVPALVHARAVETCRQESHPVSSAVGMRGGLGSLARLVWLLVVVAILARRERWAAE
ncbi:hypothetical protein FB451DRAFT_1551035 [Mycena latifolia]|nr:hypothetical protein FB451DRAFT_1551035 [Mycena latifolia]